MKSDSFPTFSPVPKTVRHNIKTPEYAKAQEAARKAKRGLWSEQGAVEPQEWRMAKKGKRRK